MDLFKKKKFPKYIKGPSDIPYLPAYESQMEEFTRPTESPNLELSKPELPKIKMPKKEFEKPSFAFPEEDLGELKIPRRMPGKFELREPEEEPESVHKKSYASLPHMDDTEPIYVKIEDYKKAVRSISLINDKLNKAEDLLNDIIDLKKEEDGQLSEWQKEVAEIKSKLMEVHKGLFEVGR